MRDTTHGLHTFVDLVHARAGERSDRNAFTFLNRDGASRQELTLGELDRKARAIAARLLDLKLKGERALLLYPPGLDYIAAYFGCLYAGVVAVPMYPPPRGKTSARHLAVIQDAAPAAVIADAELTDQLDRYGSPAGAGWHVIDAATIDPAAHQHWQRPAIDGDTIAFLQYTSGSTSTPKGVMVTHRNLLENSRLIQQAFRTSPETNSVIWLPPYHDMGLIGGILQPLFAGFHATMVSPVSFVLRPRMWLQLISDTRAHISGGPNFAYDLCVDRIGPQDLERLDLSSWAVAFNGAEPVRAGTLQRFAEKFAPCGFKKSAFFPCYGLAEATLFVSGRGYQESGSQSEFLPDSLTPGKVPQRAPAGGTTLVSSGTVPSDVQVVIADPDTGKIREPGQVGEIWVAATSVAAGYWKRQRETEEVFHARVPHTDDRFLRTGDLGFLADGQLYVTGRCKDLLIVRGRNHYPQDIEYTVERAHSLLRANSGAALSWEVDGREELVIAQEVHRSVRPDKLDDIVAAIRGALAREHGLMAHAIALVRTGGVPKTSSGKIQRFRCKEMLASKTLDLVHYVEPGATAPSVELAGVDEALWPATVRARLRDLLAGRLQGELDDVTPLVALGMDSIGALEIQSAVLTSFGVEVPLDDLLGGISFGDLVDLVLVQAGEPREGAPRPGAEQRTGEERHPLSTGQQALWFLEQQFPDTSAQHIYAAIRFLTPIDEGALGRVMQRLLDRHPALRTAIRVAGGEPYQVVQPHQQVAFVIEDAVAWSEAELQQRLTRDASGRLFSLEQGNMLRAVLFRRRDTPVLSIVIHHIAADMWSLALLTDELGQLYRLETGHEVSLRPASPDDAYCAFARKQRAMLQGKRGEELWSYWSKQLEGCKPVLDLPTDRPRPRVQSYRGDTTTFEIDADTTRVLRALAAREDATVFSVALAVFQALLHRYTREEDFLVGIAAANRTDAAYRDVMGYFVNPLLIRSRLDSSTPFIELLRATKGTVLGALAHQDFPFPALVERLKLQRDPSRPPGYQVLFSFATPHLLGKEGMGAFQMGRSGARMKIGDLEVESMDLVRRTAQVDMTFVLSEVGDRLVGMINYSADLFDQVSIDRFAARYATLARILASQPQAAIDSGDLLSDAERRRIEECNATPAEFPHDRTLAELFLEQVDRNPDSPALTFGDMHMTYRELARVANALARRLQELGAAPEKPVALYLDRDASVMAGMVAVAISGAYYVPLDPAHPMRRLRTIVDECRARIVLGRGQVPAELVPPGAVGLDIEPFMHPSVRTDAANDARVPSRATPENMAYVIFTSGSSGTPKGNAIFQRSVANYILNNFLTLKPGDRFAQLSNAAFDASTLEVWGAFLHGAHLVGFDRSTVVSPPLLAKALRESNIHTMYLNAAVLNSIVECAPDTFVAVKHLFFGGDFADAKRIRAALEAGGTNLYHIYGTTEATVFSTWCRVTEVPPNAVRLPIGDPIHNTSLYVLDRNLQHQPFGMPGEIYIGGIGVGRGYLDMPALTAEKFLPDPYSGEPGARMYATRDLGRRLQDGSIEMLGRIDFQIKIRGFRVELAEIEAAVLAHPAVVECVAIIDPARPDDKRLLCYYAGKASAAELRAFVAERVPEYMVPARFVRLDVLPKTPNNKVSRRDLPPPGDEPVEAAPAAAAHGDELENALAAVFAELLGRPQVGLDDNFFELGGHSLLATRLIVHVSEKYGVDLPLNELFNNPTIRSLATHIKSVKGGGVSLIEQLKGRSNSLEGELTAVFAQLLGVKRVGPDDNFFELGGHSLLATKLIVHISEKYGVDLPLNELFNNPTVRSLADHVKSVQGGGSPGADPVASGPKRVSREGYRRDRSRLGNKDKG